MSYINKIHFHRPSGILSCGPEMQQGKNIKESKSKGLIREMEDVHFILNYPEATNARVIYNPNINKTKLDMVGENGIIASRVVQGDNIDRLHKMLSNTGFDDEHVEIAVSNLRSIANIDGLDALGTKEQTRVQRALIDLEMKHNKRDNCPIVPSEYDTIRVSENGDEVLLESYSKKAFLDFETNKKIMAEANQDGTFEITYYDEDGTTV